MDASELCESDFVDIKIIPPTLQDIMSMGKGTAVCQVTQKKGSVEKIFWENNKGKDLHAVKDPFPNGSKKTVNVSLTITFSEWSRGFKLYCTVVHKDVPDPVKKDYERIPGKNTTQDAQNPEYKSYNDVLLWLYFCSTGF